MPRKPMTTKAAKAPVEQPAPVPEPTDMVIDFAMVERFVALLEKSNLTEFEIETSDVMLRLSKNGPASTSGSSAVSTSSNAAPAAVAAPVAPVAPSTPVANKKLVEVTSPMVGTFYAAPSPDSESYVKLGDSVREGQTLCIIEAMKLMNEIEAEASGKIAEICVKNGSPVEFGTVLFRIEP